MERKTEEPRKKESMLENVLGSATGLGLGLFHSIQMYNLMDRAGMYLTSEPPGPAYPELGTLEGVGYQLTATLGTAALFFGGFYLGRLAGRMINRLIRENK